MNLAQIDCPPKRIVDYAPIVPDTVREIFKLSKPLAGLRIAHVNATAVGGGVAEMLRFIVPLQCDLGFDSRWYVIPGNERFFEITKEIHNFMQGKPGDLTKKQKKIYLDYNGKIAGLLAEVKTDILIIHDPQPAAALTFLNGLRPKFCIWRCHIDTSRPNKKVWNFLLPYLAAYDHFVFTMPEYANYDFPKDKLSIITPVIDPLSPKNQLMKKEDARRFISQFGINIKKPLITQVSRLDPWKDPDGIVDAFLLAKKKIPGLQLALVAQMADDDPEGIIIYEKMKKRVKREKDIFLLVNLPDNDTAVNAFQTSSDIILQKSLREGFGLTVTEAMWKGAVVIGGNVGGIKFQIKDGINGFLVDSPQVAAKKIVQILENPEIQKVGKAGRESVKRHFLAPQKILNYLNLFSKLLSKEKEEIHYRQAEL